MANPTTNFGWVMPNSADLVTDLPADFNIFGQGVDTSMVGLLGGTTGQVLSKTSGTNMAFTWVTTDDANAIQNSIMDAKGDLIAATADNTPSRVGVGANGTVLTSDSSAGTGVAWSIPSSGGMTLLASASLGTSNSITISSLSQSYKDLKVYLKGYQASADFYIGFRLNGDTSTNYSFSLLTNNASSAFISFYQNQDYTYGANYDAAGAGYFAELDIYDYTNATTRKAYQFNQQALIYDASFKTSTFGVGQYHPATAAAVTSITFKLSVGQTFSAGTYEIYGVK